MAKSDTLILRSDTFSLSDRLCPLKLGARTLVRRRKTLALRSHLCRTQYMLSQTQEQSPEERGPYSGALSGVSAHSESSLSSTLLEAKETQH